MNKVYRIVGLTCWSLIQNSEITAAIVALISGILVLLYCATVSFIEPRGQTDTVGVVRNTALNLPIDI